MPLTVQVNGSVVGGQPNTIVASWFNDYHDLLTGIMADQDVTLKTVVEVQAISSPPAAPAVALAAGGSMLVGVYSYAVTFGKAGLPGETNGSPTVTVTTTTGNQTVNMTAIPLGPAGVTKRNIYRTQVGGSTYYLIRTFNDNTTTAWTDIYDDTHLGTSVLPAVNTLGGVLIAGPTGIVHGAIYTNGSVSFDNGSITSDGAGNLTVVGLNVTSLAVSTYYVPASTTIGLAFKDNGSGQIEFDAVAPSTIARGIIFAGWDGSALHQGVKVDKDGTVTMAIYDGALATIRNVRVYVGTTDPATYVTPNEGDIWIDA